MSTEAEKIRDALRFLSADDRDDWVRIGMAVKSELGEAGRAIWMEWSATSPAFKEKAAGAVWRSFREGGAITVGTLYHEAKRAGWTWTDDGYRAPAPARDWRAERERREREEAQRDREAARAGEIAQRMLQRATFDEHPYLVAKGFAAPKKRWERNPRSRARGLVLDGMLLVPMLHWRSGAVQGVQLIAADGSKKYHPPGMRAAQAVHRLRRPPSGLADLTWWCEGYATGLSIAEALDGMYRPRDEVIVAFSSATLARLAKDSRGVVVADHDWWRCRNRDCRHTWDAFYEACPKCGGAVTMPAGEKAAVETGLAWWMPPEVDTDANDYHTTFGIRALREALRPLARRMPDDPYRSSARPQARTETGRLPPPRDGEGAPFQPRRGDTLSPDAAPSS